MGKGTTSQKEVTIHFMSNEKLILSSHFAVFSLSKFLQRNFGPSAGASLNCKRRSRTKWLVAMGLYQCETGAR